MLCVLLSVCIDRAVFASIEDSDSDLDNHGEDSSSNTSADDHMTTKRPECCLQGAGVKEVRRPGALRGPDAWRLPDRAPAVMTPAPRALCLFAGVRGRDRPRQQLCVSSLHAGLQQPREAHRPCLPGEARFWSHSGGISRGVRPVCGRASRWSSRRRLVSQHTTMMTNTKNYMCPVCGRALSSPGSLGRHLLIHSEDRLSNCAVCGARFTDTNNFNRCGSPLPPAASRAALRNWL